MRDEGVDLDVEALARVAAVIVGAVEEIPRSDEPVGWARESHGEKRLRLENEELLESLSLELRKVRCGQCLDGRSPMGGDCLGCGGTRQGVAGVRTAQKTGESAMAINDPGIFQQRDENEDSLREEVAGAGRAAAYRSLKVDDEGRKSGIQFGPWINPSERVEMRTYLCFRKVDLHPVSAFFDGDNWILEEGGEEDRESRVFPQVGGQGNDWEPDLIAEILYV